jgi:hypothetical protein
VRLHIKPDSDMWDSGVKCFFDVAQQKEEFFAAICDAIEFSSIEPDIGISEFEWSKNCSNEIVSVSNFPLLPSSWCDLSVKRHR